MVDPEQHHPLGPDYSQGLLDAAAQYDADVVENSLRGATIRALADNPRHRRGEGSRWCSSPRLGVSDEGDQIRIPCNTLRCSWCSRQIGKQLADSLAEEFRFLGYELDDLHLYDVSDDVVRERLMTRCRRHGHGAVPLPYASGWLLLTSLLMSDLADHASRVVEGSMHDWIVKVIAVDMPASAGTGDDRVGELRRVRKNGVLQQVRRKIDHIEEPKVEEQALQSDLTCMSIRDSDTQTPKRKIWFVDDRLDELIKKYPHVVRHDHSSRNQSYRRKLDMDEVWAVPEMAEYFSTRPTVPDRMAAQFIAVADAMRRTLRQVAEAA